MDNTQFGISVQTNPVVMPISSYMFAPGIFFSDSDRDDYLSSLDSDTRDYVLKHTNEFRTRQDIANCISNLHNDK